jgi:succinylglutamic semialdehyde dehydrogenase
MNQTMFTLKGDYFNGKFVPHPQSTFDRGEECYEKFDPADLQTCLWQTHIDYTHIPSVIESSHQGFKIWKKLSVQARCEKLKAYQDVLKLRKKEIAEAISWETGKPFWETEQEASSIINKVQVTIDESLKRIQTQIYENLMDHTNGYVYHRPIGPCLVIGPFNFPCHLANGQILSALMAGNSVIFKPSEKTMYSAQLLMECFHTAQLPAGVVNLIQGGGETARRLVMESSIRGVFFTGSKEVGLKILEHTHNQIQKLVALELGGKNISIIHNDANFEWALHEMLLSSFITTGQRCSSTSIILIQRSIHEEFLNRFHELAKKIIIDHPIKYAQEPFMGPLIDERAVQHFLVFMGMGNREGAIEVMRGKVLHDRQFKGHYVSPSIHFFEKIPPEKSLFIQSEIFGPTCTLIPYDDIEEAFQLAHLSDYGLVGSLFSSNKGLYEKAIEELEVGLLNFNRGTTGAHAKLPFGGVKSSGNFRPAAVSMIDACVYPMSSLEDYGVHSITAIKGLKT